MIAAALGDLTTLLLGAGGAGVTWLVIRLAQRCITYGPRPGDARWLTEAEVQQLRESAYADTAAIEMDAVAWLPCAGRCTSHAPHEPDGDGQWTCGLCGSIAITYTTTED
ncbi:hypothetical protein LHJ74_14455 [Streptomyces sp. N2-109]|uniref:Uncharacterized protein n=1 Tax=Streptomyces gossypii TaxID=2883101 RepID=A0ABT2JT90_9ACTN|nr:hypothetical protein [Streptomyces gossypii]MCT2591095.1 hypothetical protein [Streptomyces gossypii]